jgi:predicted ATPase/class 3 adenylate cyclase
MSAHTGAITFLFTDVEGSTIWWEQYPDAMGPALRRHDAVIKNTIEANNGDVFATGGDGFAIAFEDPNDALRAASSAQDGLAGAAWDDTVRLRVRMGIHTGLAEARGGDYFGSTLNRAARLMSVGHGGQVLVSDATRGLTDPDAWQLKDLGRHRLKDVSHPQRIFQLGDESFEALRGLQGAAGNLPHQRTSFIGRHQLVDDIAKTLDNERLVTLTGVGGVGKTRVAIEIARRFSEENGDGAWLCSLAESDAGDTLVDTVNLALGIRADADLTGIEALHLWLSNRDLLLVLDNCEHVIDAAADLAESILDVAPNVKILATSREGLAVQGERLFAVPALGLPDAGPDSASDAVELFVARALGVRADFDPNPSADAVAEITRRLDGIPLAIELAAARVETMSAVDVLDNLDQRFDLLTGGRGRRRDRHQTLRHTVRWSYDLLDDVEQAIFRRLSVFATSFELDTAAKICAAFDMSKLEVVETLSSLGRKSLVEIEDGAGTTRYRYLETMRAFAEELNEEADELDPAMDALSAWMIEWLGGIPTLYLNCRIDEATSMIDVEEPNLRRVLNWARDHDDVATVAMVFAPFGMFVFWGGDRLSQLASEYVEMEGFDEAPGAHAALALAAFDSYEHVDHARGVAFTERGFAAAARTGETAYTCELSRWVLDFILSDDREVEARRRVVDAAAEAVSKRLMFEEAAMNACLLAHDSYRGSFELMEAGGAKVRQRATECEWPLFEMLAELFCGVGENLRDVNKARGHIDRAAELDGLSRLFIGNVIRQELGSHAILSNDDDQATTVGSHLARHAADSGRQNFLGLAAAILTGPIVRAGDANIAAKLAGWVSVSPFFANIWLQEIPHVTARARAALPAERFDQAFAAGKQASLAEMSDLILDRLATLEALTTR